LHFTTVATEGLITLFTAERIFASKTESLLTPFTPERIFTLTTEIRLAHSAVDELTAALTECLVAAATNTHVLKAPIDTDSQVALLTDK
jgi:hypothetical protein